MFSQTCSTDHFVSRVATTTSKFLSTPLHPELTHFRVRLRTQKSAIVAASTNPTKAMYKSSHTSKNPGQRLIFPAILIAFCIMGALAGFLLPIMFFPAVGSVARLLRTDSRDDPVATKVPFFTCAF